MSIRDREYQDAIYEQWARVGKAMSSPKRLELLDLLAQGPRTVEALARQSSMTVANASQHLKALRAARLVESQKKGLYVTYRIAGRDVSAFLRAMRLLAQERIAEIGRLTHDFTEKLESLEGVDRRQLLERVRAGKVTVLDVRPREEFLSGHIPGAISIPLKELRLRLTDLPKSQTIVAYCRGPHCVLAPNAVRLLKKQGFHAVRLEDGIPDWTAHGLPVATGERQ